MEKMTIGKRIRLARKELGLTSEKLSEACYIDAIYLRQIEAGMKIPSLQVFILICQALKVSPSYLLIDSVAADDFLEFEEFGRLWKTASPSQLHLITSMIRNALECLEEIQKIPGELPTPERPEEKNGLKKD